MLSRSGRRRRSEDVAQREDLTMETLGMHHYAVAAFDPNRSIGS
jgi:hypothetical protein